MVIKKINFLSAEFPKWFYIIIHPFSWIFFLIISIAASMYFDPYGGITHDAPSYLRLAQSIVNGGNWNVMSPDFIDYFKPRYFFNWPPLYPLMITGMMKITFLNCWISARILNLLLASIVVFLLYRKFKSNYFFYLIPILHAGMFDMFFSIWSEIPFVCFFIFWIIVLNNFIATDKKYSGIKLLFFTICLTLIRYQGVSVLPAMLVVAAMLRKNNNSKKSKQLFFITCISSSLIFIFIYFHNLQFKKTEYLWTPDLNDILRFGYYCFRDFISLFEIFEPKVLQTSFTIFLNIPLLLLWIFLLKKFLKRKNLYSRNKEIFIAGIIFYIFYMLIPCVIRFTFPISFPQTRFFVPPMVMLLFSWFYSFNLNTKTKNETDFIQLKNYYTLFFLLMFSVTVFLKNYYFSSYKKLNNFYSGFNEMGKKYKKIPPCSVVAFANNWFEILRLDCYNVYPYPAEMKSISLEIDDYISALKKYDGPVFIEIMKPDNTHINLYKKSVKDFMLQHQNEKIIRIK